MAHKCKNCGDKKNYNFALNIGLCDICIGEKLERIEEFKAENEAVIRRAETAESDLQIAESRIAELEIAKTIGIQACDLLKERIAELEAEQTLKGKK